MIDLEVKLAVYRHFASRGARPSADEIAAQVNADVCDVLQAYRRLQSARLLVLEDYGMEIRMAPPFSGVPTQHVVESGGVRYFANCAWDALGIAAALGTPSRVRSRCEWTRDPLEIEVTAAGIQAPPMLFHCAVPAAQWWRDIVFT
jgi:hypothetical protein